MSEPGLSHLPGCIPASEGDANCAELRAYLGGPCPDHDALCEPGCPLGPVVPGGQYADRQHEGARAFVNVTLGPTYRSRL